MMLEVFNNTKTGIFFLAHRMIVFAWPNVASESILRKGRTKHRYLQCRCIAFKNIGFNI